MLVDACYMLYFVRMWYLNFWCFRFTDCQEILIHLVQISRSHRVSSVESTNYFRVFFPTFRSLLSFTFGNYMACYQCRMYSHIDIGYKTLLHLNSVFLLLLIKNEEMAFCVVICIRYGNFAANEHFSIKFSFMK